MAVLWLTLASFASWFLSTLAGGGTPLILIPIVGSVLGSSAIAPVLTIGMMLGHPQRVWLYRRHINWQVTNWYLPGAIVGASLGAFTFTRINWTWLPIVLAFLLLISTFSCRFQEDKSHFRVNDWYFLPAGFLYAFLSGLIGSTGPLLNPLYLNYGLGKEEMIATKSVHMIVAHIAKIIVYTIFGALNPTYWGYGLIIGLAALPGNWLGQIVLGKMSELQFKKLVVSFVFVSSMLMLWEQRTMLVFW